MGCILGHECCKYENNMTYTLYIDILTAQCSSAPPEVCEQCVSVFVCVCVCVKSKSYLLAVPGGNSVYTLANMTG